MSSFTDQRIDPLRTNDGRIDRPAAVAEIHVTRLIINAEQVETRNAPPTARGAEPTQTGTHHRRHSASELTAFAVIPVSAPEHSRHGARPRTVAGGTVPRGPVSGPVPVVIDGAARVPRAGLVPGAARNARGQPAPLPPYPSPRSKCDELMSRCCLSCLVVPFILALSLMVFSMSTFAVMDSKVRKSCTSLSCSLSCYNHSTSTFLDCGVVYAGGGLVCLMSFLSIFSITVRICYGVKILGSCVVCEVFIHLVNLAVSATVALTLSIDTDRSCLQNRCANFLDVQELMDFIREAAVGAWLSMAMMVVVVFLWMMLGLRTCFEPYGHRRQRQREDGERQRLVNH